MKKVKIICMDIFIIIGGIIFFSLNDKKKILDETKIKKDNTLLVFMLQDEEGNYNKSENLPNEKYILNTNKSVCSNGATIAWKENILYFDNLTKNGTSCYLYFDIKPLAATTILANYPTVLTRNDFSTTVTETTTGTIYKSKDSS